MLSPIVLNYAEPIIEKARLFGPKDSDVAEVSQKFYDEFNKIKKEIYD